jgi:hypothetical protein
MDKLVQNEGIRLRKMNIAVDPFLNLLLTVSNSRHRGINRACKVSTMSRTDLAEWRRLVLQVARDVVAKARLRTLLTEANSALTGHRRELVIVKTRLRRAKAKR